jgi:hypothetical protein
MPGRGATKDSIWPPPDWRVMVERGADPVAAAMVKVIRDRLPTAPRSAAEAADYVLMMARVRDRLAAVRTVEEARSARGDLLEAAGWPRDGRSAPTPAARRLLSSVWRDGRDTLHLDYRDIHRASALVASGWPGAAEAWRRGHVVRRDPDGGWMLARGGTILADGFGSEPEAWAWLASRIGEVRNTRPSRARLARATREGLPPASAPTSPTPADLADEFGLASAETGRRGPTPGTAWESLSDLATALGIERRAIGLSGTLSLSIGDGAPGRSVYDRELRAIVLPGGQAGELARAWGLAFHHWAEEGGLDCEALGSLDLALRRSDPRAVAHVTRARAALACKEAETERVRAQRASYLARNPGAASDAEGAAYLAAADRWLADASSRALPSARQALAAAESRDIAAGESAFAAAARSLARSHGGDWASPAAMFARCLACAVNDALAAAGGRNQFLVHGVEEGRHGDPDPYPRGRERLAAGDAVRAAVASAAPRLAANALSVAPA